MSKREQILALKEKHPDLGPTAVADRVGCAVSYARAAINGYSGSGSQPPSKTVRYSEQESQQRILRIRDMCAEGRSWAEIGRAMGYRD